MSDHDVFISYSRADRDAASAFAEALTTRGYDVWWDFNLVGGSDFRADIEAALDRAEKVIVLWSANSINSAFVLDEAGHGRNAGKLLPVSIDGAQPPFGFGNLHTLDIRAPEAQIETLIAAIENRAPPDAPTPSPQPTTSRRTMVFGGAAAAAASLGAGGWWYAGRETPVIAGPRIALVVGAGEYAQPYRLENALNDAKAVAAALIGLGFDVIEETNPDSRALTRAIDRFQTLLARGGVGLFYFSGHAVHIEGRDILIPVDAATEISQGGLFDIGVDIAELTGPVDQFFIDPDGMTKDQRRDNGVSVLYAADEGEVAWDAPPDGGDQSPFSTAFLDALAEGETEFDAVARRVRQMVRAATDGAQNPVHVDRSDAPFDFNLRTPDPIGVLRIIMLDSSRSNPFTQGDRR